MALSQNQELLIKAKELLKNETTKITYDTWIQPLDIKEVDGNRIVLLASNSFQKDTVESKYLDLLTNTFNFVTNKQCQISIELAGQSSSENKDDIQDTIQNKKSISSGLNPRYTFENFVVGDNNKFAQAAALGIAENPGSKYNPLFLYGGPGLGKTHLMHAIGNYVLQNMPEKKVLYVTSEAFTNQLINSLKDQSTDKFRERYRNIDVLLIDDIQFIANKKSTQEEFFHTFNTLYEASKQTIISSDKPPKDLNDLEERLISRFEMGVLADIGAPNYETRLAILRKRAEEDKVIVDDDILAMIATNVESNIREIEGILNKLIYQSSLSNSPITMEMATKAVNNIVKSKEKVITPEYIEEVVAKYFNINVKDLSSAKRSSEIVFPRQIAMYLCSNICQMSSTQIGKAFGNRDHSTVMHSIGKIENDMKNNSNTKLIVESVENLLKTNN